MSYSVPLTFRSAPFPDDYRADPEQFKNDLVARLYAESTENISFFVTGSIAPSSNVGPWLKDGMEWWVWSDTDAAYIPQVIPQIALRFIASNTSPDQNDYVFWIELDGTGKAIAIKYYSGGAWKDVYEDKFAEYYTSAQTDAAITTAIGGLSNYPAQGVTGVSPQSIPTTSTPTKIQFSVAAINPSPAPFNTSTYRYIAPATGTYHVSTSSQVDNVTGTASSMEVSVSLYKNGVFAGNALADLDSTSVPSGNRWSPGFAGLISLNQGDYIEIWCTAADGVGSGTVDVTVAQFSIFRVA